MAAYFAQANTILLRWNPAFEHVSIIAVED
jgi:hypothetical protein